MKRSCDNDAGSASDEEIFSYSNKLKLTFVSSPLHDDFRDDDDSSVYSDSEEDISENKCEEVTPNNLKVTKLFSKASKVLSPSPPPPTRCGSDGQSNLSKLDLRSTAETISLLKQQLDISQNFGCPDVICLTDDDVPRIKLKIRLHGAIERFELLKTEPLNNLIQQIAKKEGVEPGFLTLNWGDVAIDPSQSASELRLTVADILECIIHAEDVNDENKITVKVQSAISSSSYKVNMCGSLERILLEFCMKNKASMERSKFRVDGELVDVKKTFSMLDMIDGDIIDADLVLDA